MEYPKVSNLIDDLTNQPCKFRTKNWVEINDDRHGAYDKINLRFKTVMLNASLCDYSDAYVLVEGRITVVGQGANDAAVAANKNKK